MTDLPKTGDYLAWARGVQDIIDAQPALYNLFSSASATPRDLLRADLAALTADDWFVPVSPWGHEPVAQQIAATCGVAADRVLVTSGASNGLVVVARAFVQPGDRVIVEAPAYQPFVRVLEDAGAQIVRLPRLAEQGFALDLDALETALQDGARLILLSNLHNPSAAWLAPDALTHVIELAERAGALVVIDEVYQHFVTTTSAAALADHVVAISSLSKTYGMGSLRCGWLIAAPSLQDRLREVHTLYENTVSAMAQALAARVWSHIGDYRALAVERAAANRECLQAFAAPLIADGLIAGDVPEQGCVYFPRLVRVSDADAFSRRAVRDFGVVVVPGTFFEMPGHIRIGYGGDGARLAAGLERLADAIRAGS
ncbi:MAG: pyridoxal phosphate-dependent aminotransferase [Anaerolineae bacterium]|nr:pyridoxal phosphate-dependent aminotransferase [Anaerolineae bacterium]